MKAYNDNIESMIEEMLDMFGHLPQEQRETAIEEHEDFSDSMFELQEEVFTSISEQPQYLATDPEYSNLPAVTEWAVEEHGFKGNEILQSIRQRYFHFRWTFSKDAYEYLKKETKLNPDFVESEKDMLRAFALCVDNEIYDVFDGIDWDYTYELHDVYMEDIEFEAIQKCTDNEMMDHRREILDSIHLRAERMAEGLAA